MELTGKVKTMLIAGAVGMASGIVVGVIVDKLASRKEQHEGEIPMHEDPDFDGDRDKCRVIASTNGYVDDEEPVPVIAQAFEKPDISQMVDYTKFSKKTVYGVVEKPEEKGEPSHTETISKLPTHDGADFDGDRESYIEIISEDEFLRATGNEDGYVSVVGTWFPEDKVLAGWNEELQLKSVEDTVGWDVMSAFDDEETRAVYVRNTKHKVLYEIVRGSGTYEDSSAEG